MPGYWWLQAKAYLRDVGDPKWLNKDACVAPEAQARFGSGYADTYFGDDRSLPLIGRPHFDLPHRERRVLDLRSVSDQLDKGLNPYFLMSREFADVVLSVDPDALYTAECDVSYHGRAPYGVCLMADARVCVDGWDVLDRVKSNIELKPGFSHETGEPFRLISVRGPIHFKPGTVDGAAMIRVRIGPNSARICISDALADAIFAREFLGLELEDASGDRKAPERYALYKTKGWEGSYPG